MVAGHALGKRWMGLYASSVPAFLSTHDPRTENLLFFARAPVVRRSCVSTRYWSVEGAALTLRIFLCAVLSSKEVGYVKNIERIYERIKVHARRTPATRRAR